MPLSSGTRLGSYELIAQIGGGGMGEVYKAHDTKLGRDVAIKILPEAFAHDAERLARFQREAKMLAALNHPNIATIHGLEQSNSTHYLVMELVLGETLADRIKLEGSVPVEEALNIAVQIAEALEAAHEKGIIHRDLKPANVKVTPEGKVKVLDFGLAKAFGGDTTDSSPSQSPTLSAVATMQGVLLGTAAYMSPEQARGKAVDKRTDIWAFGCVLYELLTGKQAFDGDDITDILAAVVRAEPNWNRLPPATTTKIRDLLRRCLQKDKTLRMRDAGDIRIEIQEALAAPLLPGSPTAALPRRTVWRWVLASAVTCLIVTAIVGFAVWNLKPSRPLPVTRTLINLPLGQQLAGLEVGPAIALSPDGTHLVYVASQSLTVGSFSASGGTPRLYLRALDSLEAKPISGTEGAIAPFFSPDGQWLGFFASAKLKKVSVSGGAVVTLADAPGVPLGASWGSQGTIALGEFGGIQQVSDEGGALQPLTHLEKGDLYQVWPEFLPRGDALLFDAVVGASPQISVQSLRSGSGRNLASGGTPRYASSGHLLYAQGGTLMAAPFDVQRLTVTGTAVPVVEGVLQSPVTGIAQYSISSTGSLTYASGPLAAQSRLVWVSRNGAEQPVAAPPHIYGFLRLSPDGRRLAVTITEQESQHIWLYDFARETLSPFTFGEAADRVPIWMPDGKRIAFISTSGGRQNLYWQLADGSGGLEQLTTGNDLDVPAAFSSDSQVLALFGQNSDTTGYGLSVLRLSDRKVQRLPRSSRTQSNDAVPSFSPDGHWLAYVSDESGRFEVYVQPYPGPGGKYQISTEGGMEPMWNPRGKELFYRNNDKMMAVDITTQPNFAAGKPRMLFQGPYLNTTILMPYYDVSPDGERFLMLKPVEQAAVALTQIIVVQNWFEELKRRVPTGK